MGTPQRVPEFGGVTEVKSTGAHSICVKWADYSQQVAGKYTYVVHMVDNGGQGSGHFVGSTSNTYFEVKNDWKNNPIQPSMAYFFRVLATYPNGTQVPSTGKVLGQTTGAAGSCP